MIRLSGPNGREREVSAFSGSPSSDSGSLPARAATAPGLHAPGASGAGAVRVRVRGAGERETHAQMSFDAISLRSLRRFVARHAAHAGISRQRSEDLVLAVDELATNSITYGGGTGTLLVWRDEDQILCEVRDGGHIEDPLVGLRPPAPEQPTGRGLWIVRNLCDSVQIHSSPGHTVVRIRMSLG